MVSFATTRRFRLHAGLERDTGDNHGLSVAACVGEPSVSADRLDAAVADLLDAMVSLNTELNGDVPSESREATQDIPRELAYAVAEVTRLLRNNVRATPEVIRASEEGAWLAEVAWTAVLAGDIDDLRAHLREERVMRA